MTVQEILRQTGMTEEQIQALDEKVMSGFTTVLSTSEQNREAAELAKRIQDELYNDKIAPALNDWAIEKAQKDAELAFYKTQAEGAKSGGFIPKDAPGYVAPAANRDASGQFVAGQNAVPGSPAFLSKDEGIRVVSNVVWSTGEYQRLYGKVMPDEFESLLNESVQARLPFRDYVSKKYGFTEKKAEIAALAQKEHDDKIRAEAIAGRDKEWAEKTGNNPMVRIPQESMFTNLKKAEIAGQRKDPLTMTENDRRNYTRQNIQQEMADHAGQTVQ